MFTTKASLPNGFQDLEEHASVWAGLKSQQERYRCREESSIADLRAFYDKVAPRLEEIFSHLDKFPRDNLPEPEQRLFRTALGLSEAGQAIESFGEPGIPYARKDHDLTLTWKDRTPTRKSV